MAALTFIWAGDGVAAASYRKKKQKQRHGLAAEPLHFLFARLLQACVKTGPQPFSRRAHTLSGHNEMMQNVLPP